MNRRTFNTLGLSALLAALPRLPLAQHAMPDQPGYQFAEIKNGHITTAYRGMANPHNAVDDDTLFQAASCSKTVTALAVLTLVRDGRVALDEPVNLYLRRWQLPGPRGNTTTIAELLSHSAGTSVDGFVGYGPDVQIPTLRDILSGQSPANSDPVRTRHRLFGGFRYSGGGITVLQMMIEDVTGTDFATYTMAEVLYPAGAPRATFAITPDAPFALGSFDTGRPVPGGYRRHPESAAAGLWATATDLAKILRAVMRSLSGANDAILPVELAQRMITPVCAESGLGIFVYPGAVIAHSGRNFGFDSVMAAELETGIIRTAMTNQNGAINAHIEELTS